MLMCNYKYYEYGAIKKQEYKKVELPFDEIVTQKMTKLLIKIKEIKIVHPEAEVDETLDAINKDLFDFKRDKHICRNFRIGANVFSYEILKSNQKFHIYKSLDDKTSISIRDYHDWATPYE